MERSFSKQSTKYYTSIMKLLPLVSVGFLFAQSVSANFIQKRDTVGDILDDIKTATTCTACQV